MSKIDELAKVLIDSTEIKDKKKTSAYDTTAKVVAVEGNTAWVSIAGGVEKTPASMVVAAKVGDDVRVRVGGGKAYVTGNVSAPPTDDSYARRAEEQALRAYRAADSASKSATEAQRSANSAIDSATIAGESATRAVADAAIAKTSADQAIADAAVAHDAADAAQASADEAQSSADAAQGSADDAQRSADDAQASADTAEEKAQQAIENAEEAHQAAVNANTAANNALSQLSVVEDVVGVLDLLSKHGEYALTTDTAVREGKWYFTRSGEGTTASPYVYAVADLAVGSDPTGHYELTSIDEAITNYVSSHLALTDEGLYLQQAGSEYRILISTNGLEIQGAEGTIASYGTDTVIGNRNGFHVQIDATELGFYQGAQKVAYINNNQLYITQSVVLQQMDLGTPIIKGGLGQWTWKVHPNSETPRRNNLNLKWIG